MRLQPPHRNRVTQALLIGSENGLLETTPAGRYQLCFAQLQRRTTEELAAIARQLGNALAYPVMPYAPTGDAASRSGHMRLPGSVSVSEATYAAVAREVAQSARAAGFRNIILMGDHGGGQGALASVAAELDQLWSGEGVRVRHVPEVYTSPDRQVREYLAARGLPAGEHAGIHDTAELLFLDASGLWVRRERMQPGDGANGVDGDPRAASAKLGRIFLGFKIEAGVAGIRRALSSPR